MLNEYTKRLETIEQDLHALPVGNKRSEYLDEIYYPSLKVLVSDISANCTEITKLAEYLHQEYCTLDHTEKCSWFYEGDDWTRFAHRTYLIKALKLMEFIDEISK